MSTAYASGDAPGQIRAGNLTTRLWEQAVDSPDTPILCTPRQGEGWQDVTWRQLAERVRAVAAGLIATGIRPGDRVALMSGTRLEWTVSDLAILAAGAVVVPIYETSSADQCAWILSNSGARLALAAETGVHGKALEEARGEAPDLGEILVFDEGALDELGGRGGRQERAQVGERTAALSTDDVATIVYTSGTTGPPKGCVLTHGNFLFVNAQVEAVLGQVLQPRQSILLFLPLAHVFTRAIQFVGLATDSRLGYARSLGRLQEDLASFQPDFLLGVPRMFEKVFDGARRKAGGVGRRVFDFATATAGKWASARRPGPLLRMRLAAADRLVYARVREAVGGRVRYGICGGAPLSPHVLHFFHAAGLQVLEGYGLTETTGPITLNTPDALRLGTVGRPLPGVEVRIADDDEILTRGGNVFRGYLDNPEATAEVLEDDGWFHTEDLGRLDGEGFLTVTGRKKDLIVTATGQNVVPGVLEGRLSSEPLVSQALVIGDDRPFIAALITLEPDELGALAREHGLSGSGSDLHESRPVRETIERAVEHANDAVSRAESIRAFAVLDREFREEDDELTPTAKPKRETIAEHFPDEIEGLYGESPD